MIHTDLRANEIAEATAEIERLKPQLSSATLETFSDLAAALQRAIKRKEVALAMLAHQYECLCCPKGEDGQHQQFISPARTVLEVSAIILHDPEGNVINEQHYSQPRFIVICPYCTDEIRPVEYLTQRWKPKEVEESNHG